MLPTDELRQVSRPLGVETAVDDTFSDHSPRQYRLGKPLQLVWPGSLIDEHVAKKPLRALSDQNGVWFGQGLQARGQVRSNTDGRLLLRRIFAEGVANNHQSCCNPH